MGSNNVFTAIMKPLADLIRQTVTTFPVFALRNVVRDTQSRLIISRTGGSLKDLLKSSEYKDAFEVFGGSQAGFYLINEQAYNKELNKSIEKLTKSGTL